MVALIIRRELLQQGFLIRSYKGLIRATIRVSIAVQSFKGPTRSRRAFHKMFTW